MNVSTVVFLASVAFVLYVLIGYPSALAFFAKRFPRPIVKRFEPHRITVIVPVRNGERWIRAKLDSLLASDYPPDLIDILIVSDGSTDSTNQIVANYPDSRVRLLALPAGGKATAVTRAVEQTSSDILVLTDVRQAFDPQAIRLLVACFADPKVGVVTGELVIREGNTQEEFNTGLYWKYEKWIRRNLNRVDAMLGVTGSIYAARREAMPAIPPEILLDDVYVPFKAVFAGYRIYFEDQAKAYDLPTSLHSEFRRKVRTQAGVYQIIRYFPALLWPGNRRFIHFFSHKFGRLLLPFALIAIFVSSFGLPDPWRWLVLAAEACWYGAAFLDRWLPERFPLKRLTAPIRAFVVLVAAAFCALAVFFLPARTLWKETKVSEAKAA
ncbi:MAG TPA: glycosyltransferase family 2 protein [Bryobacteraceae bacterium]|jgi:cellulose synthase/poly-beta-1,6-N-acetylglucosamine synthase-like glycosyltransferase|nr:glycosyltransferase family 2 protein [Bryobacteraceae bacterium]